MDSNLKELKAMGEIKDSNITETLGRYFVGQNKVRWT